MAKLQNLINQKTADSSIHTLQGSGPYTSLGSGASSGYTAGGSNTAIGYEALNSNNSFPCTAVGYQALQVVSTSQGHSSIGANSLKHVTSLSSCTAAGNQCLEHVTGANSTGLGSLCIGVATTSSACTAIGYSTGSAYTGSESSNILIGSPGVVGESNKVRIGTQGSASQEQNAAFIVGTLNVSGPITTQPVDSSTATAAFPTSLTLGTSVQNTTGYNILVNMSLVETTTLSPFVIRLGVDSTSTPAVSEVFYTVSSPYPISFSAIVPNTYWLLLKADDLITPTITVQTCPI